MFTHLSGWKSRVEIDQRASEGRLRQEWREAPHENNRVSIPVIFWSVLRLVAQRVESLLQPPQTLGCSATQSRPITTRFRRWSKCDRQHGFLQRLGVRQLRVGGERR